MKDKEVLAIISLETPKIWIELEQLRENLYGIADRTGIDSPEAIRASTIMDNKLNEYYRLKE